MTCIFYTAFAGPWLLPGNLAVKSDIDLLAEAGLIKTPVMIWPIAWVNIGPQLLSVQTQAKLPREPQDVQAAYHRILALYQNNNKLNQIQSSVYASGSHRLNPFRTFQSEPYSDFVTGGAIGKTYQHFAANLNVSYYNARNQSYSDHVHFNNSYGYFLLGNWALGVDQFNRWWGPAYSDSMILSQNIEPFPTVTLQRLSAVAFKTKWLRWIGPWSFTTSLSKDGPAFYPYPSGVDDILFWYSSLSFRPRTSLQFDISRSTHFAGKQRPVNGAMLLHILMLQNAYDGHMPPQEVPGSDEWDIGLRWGLQNTFHIPVDFYMQTLFSGIYGWMPLPVPDCTTFLLGTSVVTQLETDTLRTYFEYENNLERAFYFWGRQKGDETGGVIPNPYGGPYPYTYYDRVIGSPLGSEGVGYTVGMILNENTGDSDTATLRFLQLNSLHYSVTPGVPGYPFAKQNVVWASIGRTFKLANHFGSMSSELGYLFSVSKKPGLSSGLSATVTWFKNF